MFILTPQANKRNRKRHGGDRRRKTGNGASRKAGVAAMNSLIPLKQKLGVLWSYNSQVFSPAEPHIRGQLCVSFVWPAEGILRISYGLCGDYKLEYNNLLKKNDSGVLFDVEKDMRLPAGDGPVAFAKNQRLVEDFQLSFPPTTALFAEPMPLPTSCLYYGDEQGYETQLSVKYKLYVKVTYFGGFPKKEKTETLSFPLTYQGLATFQSAPSLLYREFAVFPIVLPQQSQTSVAKTPKLLTLPKSQGSPGLDLIMELKMPSFLDMNAPLFSQLFIRFITNYSIDSLAQSDFNLALKDLKVSVYYYSTFVSNKSTSKHQRKKKMFRLNFSDSSFQLGDFQYDQVNSYHYLNYKIKEHSAVTISNMVGFHSFLTNCKLFEGKFTNTSCLHLTFTISANNNYENTFKFRTEASPTVTPESQGSSKNSILDYDYNMNFTDEDTL